MNPSDTMEGIFAPSQFGFGGGGHRCHSWILVSDDVSTQGDSFLHSCVMYLFSLFFTSFLHNIEVVGITHEQYERSRDSYFCVEQSLLASWQPQTLSHVPSYHRKPQIKVLEHPPSSFSLKWDETG